jgi:tetratricopeptide (TPR) repeat protein
MIEELQAGLAEATHPYWRAEVMVQIEMLGAWILHAEGEVDKALQLAATAADREDGVDKNPVTPGEVIPARELYADMLFETGKHAESLQQYQAVLTGSPNRLNALLGAANAASHTGDSTLAEKYYAQACEQTKSGNRQRAGLDRARAASR